jgi:hypothetical protein
MAFNESIFRDFGIPPNYGNSSGNSRLAEQIALPYMRPVKSPGLSPGLCLTSQPTSAVRNDSPAHAAGFTSIFFACFGSAFGTVTLSTPFEMLA